MVSRHVSFPHKNRKAHDNAAHIYQSVNRAGISIIKGKTLTQHASQLIPVRCKMGENIISVVVNISTNPHCYGRHTERLLMFSHSFLFCRQHLHLFDIQQQYAMPLCATIRK